MSIPKRVMVSPVMRAMPPATFNKPLSPEQKQLLNRWVAEGAKYEKHWSLLPPHRKENAA